jgi:hypothetical protein
MRLTCVTEHYVNVSISASGSWCMSAQSEYVVSGALYLMTQHNCLLKHPAFIKISVKRTNTQFYNLRIPSNYLVPACFSIVAIFSELTITKYHQNVQRYVLLNKRTTVLMRRVQFVVKIRTL